MSIPGGIGMTAEERARVALLGDVGSVVGPDAPPGFPPDLATGFLSLATDMDELLRSDKIASGTIVVENGQTSGTDDTGTSWNGKVLIVTPNADIGLAIRWWATLSNGVVTVSTSAAVSGTKVFSYLVFDQG